jgi:ABC-type bacteriocin/lantibiotic exporter with double-glycine peptidase domain
VALIAGVLMSVPGIAVPVLGSVFVDGVLARGQSSWIMPIVGFALMAVVAKAVLSTVQAAVLIRLERRMCMTSSARFMEHALRLPVDFYSHRLPGEMVSRLGGIERLSQLLGAKLFPAIAGAATGVLYLVAMVSIDRRLALLSVLVAAMIAFIIARSARTLRDQSRIAEQESGRQAGIVAVGLQAMETLKASGRESDFLARVMGAQARARRSRQDLEHRGLAVESVPPYLESMLSQAIVLAFGAALVMQGELTLGGLLAFQTILYFFMGPVVDLAGFAQEFQSVHADLSRLDDVQRHPTDPLAAPTAEAPPGGANSANFNSVVDALTPVGAYTGSAGFYGTFDQGGNVWEWNDAVISVDFRGLRGGSWFLAELILSSSFRDYGRPSFENNFIGFRVASP